MEVIRSKDLNRNDNQENSNDSTTKYDTIRKQALLIIQVDKIVEKNKKEKKCSVCGCRRKFLSETCEKHIKQNKKSVNEIMEVLVKDGSFADLYGEDTNLQELILQDIDDGLAFSNAESTFDKLIYHGIGLEECTLGRSIESFISIYGGKISGESSVLSYERGIEANCENNRLRCVFYHYRQPGFVSFKGQTYEGINENATIADVEKAYGVPTKVDSSIVSSYGAFPGKTETTMEYSTLGVSFTFHDQKLSTIFVYDPDNEEDALYKQSSSLM